jgi:serine/threonine protein kinase, bacterial
MPVAVGQMFAGFTILRVLGAGGMGTVYLAGHPRLPRQDALKVLPADWTADPQYRERFLREADLTASLSHPNILGVHDRGECEGQLWISMDYVDGTDASRLLREHYPDGLPIDKALEIITAVASALDYAHQQGLLHRDIKPANILLNSHTQRVFLADFGIARLIDDRSELTATNMTVGTMAYAAPEQLRGESLDARTDQYALACTAFALLTGTPPYVDSNPAVVITKHVAAPVPSLDQRRPELAGLDPALARAMAKTPGERFPSCLDFVKELTSLLGSPPAEVADRPATQPSPRPPATEPTLAEVARRKSRRPLIAALSLVALLIVAAGGFAGVKLVQQHNRAGDAKSATVAASAHTFSGTYRANYGPATDLEGKPIDGAPPITANWGVRSACGSGGCVATASYLGGSSGIVPVSNLVFDEVGDSWIAVAQSSRQCDNGPTESWVMFTLRPQPDGTLSGDTTRSTTNTCESGKRTVTFTRTGDPDVARIPDPAALPPRTVSPAAALHGRYHEAISYSNGGSSPGQDDVTVHTECLRTGDRCMSLFHAPDGPVPLVFADGKWTRNDEGTVPCNLGGMAQIKITVEYPLPKPLQDPIPVLIGHGQNVMTGSSCSGGDFEDKFVRTGD